MLPKDFTVFDEMDAKVYCLRGKPQIYGEMKEFPRNRSQWGQNKNEKEREKDIVTNLKP